MTKDITQAAECLSRLTAELGTWQPIETAPKDGTRVILFDDYGVIDIGKYTQEWIERQEFVREETDGDVYKTVRDDVGYWGCDVICPTHWMPLPKTPTSA